MSEWLDIMLEEIARKKQEAEAAQSEQEQRKSSASPSGESTEEPSSGQVDSK